LAFWFVGPIENEQYRYFIFNLFQIGSAKLFDLANLKLDSYKDNSFLAFYTFISPIVNLFASLLWSGPILIISFFTEKKENRGTTILWKQIFFTNLILSLALVVGWYFLLDLDFVYGKTFGFSTNSYGFVAEFIYFIFFLPSIVPSFFALSALDNGLDTIHGYKDLYLLYRVNGAFVCAFWSILATILRNTSLVKSLIRHIVIKTN
jgi:hypothetical protein